MIYRFLVGAYTHIANAAPSRSGVYLYEFNSETLTATCIDSLMVKNASWVTIDGNHAYALSECGSRSLLHSLSLENNKLRLTSSIESAGDDPCHIVAHNGTLYAANYSSGSVSVVKINNDKTLGNTLQELRFTEHSDSPRQMSSHIHNIAISPNGKHLAASNLGGDCIHLLEITDNGTLSLIGTTHTHAGSGPRHMSWNNDGTRLYLITELSDEVIVFGVNGTHLVELQAVNAARTPGHGAGDIHVHPSGKFLYASVRLVDDGIAHFAIGNDGLLTHAGFYPTGKHPRNFAITPCGKLLLCACRDKNAIELYTINNDNGNLTYLSGKDIDVPLPVCISFIEG